MFIKEITYQKCNISRNKNNLYIRKGEYFFEKCYGSKIKEEEKKIKIRQVTATEIEEPKKETEYSKAKKNWRNYILKKKKRIEERSKTKKAQEKKELKSFQLNDDNSLPSKKYTRKLKTEQIEQQKQNLYDKYQNLKFKFEKMMEFTK